MLEAIERIKNSQVISTMYGRYTEVIYNYPQIIFTINREGFSYLKNLSKNC